MAKKKKKSQEGSKAVISIIVVVIIALFGYFCKGELPFELPFEPPSFSDTQPNPGNGTLGGSADTIPALTDPNYLTVHYIDVGQADAILLACGGEYMLIDAGNTDSKNTVIHYLNDLDIQRLDLVVATHGDSDHIGEMADVLKAIPADTVWYPDYGHGTKTETNFLTAASNCGATLYAPELGATYDLGGATVTVLGPVKEYDEPNDKSIVMLVQFGDNRFLFTGDMENKDGAENDLLAYWGDEALKADVLKVGHHGASTSTSYHFLRAVMPDYAVISVGEGNSYGHPTQQTLDILGQAEVYVYRTDLMGTVVAISNGSTISFRWDNVDRQPYIPDAK